MGDQIVYIGSIVGAIVIIIGAIAKLIAPIRKEAKNLSDIKKTTEENSLNILRLTFVSKEMPIGERLIAGEKYVKQGGNGEIKAEYKALAASYGKEYVQEEKELKKK